MSREVLKSEVRRPSQTAGRYFKSKKTLTPDELSMYNRITKRIKDLSSREINYDEAKELITLRNDILEAGIISYANPTIKEAGRQIADFVEGPALEKESSANIQALAGIIDTYNERLKKTPTKKYGKQGEIQSRDLTLDELRESESSRERRLKQEEYVKLQESRGFEQVPRDVLRERLLRRTQVLKDKLAGVKSDSTQEGRLRRGEDSRGQIREMETLDPQFISESSVQQGRMPQGQQGRITRGENNIGQIREMETLDPRFIMEPSVLVDRTQEGRLTRGENNIGQIREMETVEPSLLPGYGVAEIQTGRPPMPKRLPPRRPIEYEEEKHDDFGTADMDGGQENKQAEDNELKTLKPLNGTQVLASLESSIDLFTDLFKMMPENKDIFEFYENLRRQDQAQAEEFLNDIIREVEILSGANEDSLFNAEDLKQTPSVNGINGFPLSGQQRGQSARHINNIDSQHIERGDGQIGLLPVDGYNVFRNSNTPDRPQMQQPGSIEDAIRSNIELSEGWAARYGSQDRGFIRTQYSDQNSRSDLLMQATARRLNKYNPYLGSSYADILNKSGMADMAIPPPIPEETMQLSGDRVVQGGLNVPQGVAPLSIEQARAKPSGYRQPDRKYRGNAVELIRQSNRTSQALANEFM